MIVELGDEQVVLSGEKMTMDIEMVYG